MANISTIEELKHYLSEGHSVEYLFFWGHRQKKDGSISKSCLSNWYPAKFELDGILYATTEHHMMAQKAALFDDTEIFHNILSANTPDEAKTLGRKVRGFEESRWNAQRFDIVVAGNEAKFSQNPLLRDYLLSTGEKLLVEASPYDTIWGIGMAANDPHIESVDTWRGLNLLGFALMDVRRRLRDR